MKLLPRGQLAQDEVEPLLLSQRITHYLGLGDGLDRVFWFFSCFDRCCCRCHICHFCCCLLAPVVNDFTFVKVVNANAAAFVIVLLLHLSLLLLLLLMLFLLPHLSFLDAVVVVAVTFVVAVVLSKCFLSRLYSLCLHF